MKLIVIVDEFFERSKSGAIWGRVYFDLGAEPFPDAGWTDIVVGFVGAWLNAICHVALVPFLTKRAWFMDGPFAVDVSSDGVGQLHLRFMRDTQLRHSAVAPTKDLLSNAIAVAQHLLITCNERGWKNDDTRNLAVNVERAQKIVEDLLHKS